MKTVEQHLQDALSGEAARVQPGADLLDRVRRSVAADRHRRRRRARMFALVAGCSCLVVLAALAAWNQEIGTTRSTDDGGQAVSWWVLESATTLVLVGLALWLGPFIKRFGRAYAADVFHDNPLTGKSYIVLTDIVYYLIFTAYVLFTVRFEPSAAWGPTVGPEQLRYECARIGGILLIIGVLHGLNILLMPMLGRVFSLNRRLRPATTLAPSQREVIDSTIQPDE